MIQKRLLNADEQLRMIDIEEFELPKPDNYDEIVKSADELFAELLIRYYFDKRKELTGINYNDKLSIKKESINEELHFSNRGVANS